MLLLGFLQDVNTCKRHSNRISKLEYLVNKIYLCLLLLIWYTSQAQEIVSINDLRFKHYSASTHLSSNFVNCLKEDGLGYLWIGTRAGLMRYDGYDFQHVGGGNIQSVFEGKGQKLWIGTDKGLGYVEFFKDSLPYRKLPLPEAQKGITAIGGGNYGTIFFGTNEGLYGIPEGRNACEAYPVNKELHVYSISADSRGNCWIGTDQGLFRTEFDEDGTAGLKPVSILHKSSEKLEVLGIHPGQNSRLWLVLRPPIKSQNHTKQYLVALNPVSLEYQFIATPLPMNVAFDAILEETDNRPALDRNRPAWIISGSLH